MCFQQVFLFPVCGHEIPLDEVESCGRARLNHEQCEEAEKQTTEYPGKCFECHSADAADRFGKEAEEDLKYERELARVLNESKDFVQTPPAEEWESLEKILELSLKDQEEAASRLANKPRFFYDMHLRYECGHEENIGPTEIERDEEVEGLPYLVTDDNYPCPDCRGASSRAPAGRSEAFPRPVPRMTSAELPIDREDEEDDLTGLDPQARGKGPRHVAAGPPLHYEPSLEDINEARRREQQEDEFHAHPSEPDHLQDRDHHETHGHHGQDELNDSDSERSYISDDELDPLPDGDAPGYGTVDNLALARYQGEERARLEAEQRANVERIREQARQAREQDSEDEAHPPR